MALRVAINGFGRIGRCLFRAALKRGFEGMEIVAVNDITSPRVLAHLLKYDSVHGTLPESIKASEAAILVNGRELKVLSERDPAKLPWGKLGIELAVESTGLFARRDAASKHLDAGASRVLITAPAKEPDITIVPGVNHQLYDPAEHKIVSLASCTTNCVAPMAKVLHEGFGIRRGFMTTVHAYTNDQRILDLQHEDLRRARAAALSIVPTTTGAARAIGEVLPELKGRLDGIALRVPVADVSLTDLVAEVERDATVDSVNKAYREAAQGTLKGIMTCSEEPLVSADYLGNPSSAIIDLPSTMVIDKRVVKVLGWYDNEWGYSHRLVDMIQIIASKS